MVEGPPAICIMFQKMGLNMLNVISMVQWVIYSVHTTKTKVCFSTKSCNLFYTPKARSLDFFILASLLNCINT